MLCLQKLWVAFATHLLAVKMTQFAISNICTAFERSTIGSKVINSREFFMYLKGAMKDYDVSRDRVPGQHFIVLPVEAYWTVFAGDGKKTDSADDYVIRNHREGPKMFLRRACAGEVSFLACVVYTREAYMADPDYNPEEPLPAGATHVVVAVIASSGPAAPVTPYRFVHNLAGGNNAYAAPKCEDMDDKEVIDCLQGHIDWLEDEALKVKAYWDEFSVVAD